MLPGGARERQKLYLVESAVICQILVFFGSKYCDLSNISPNFSLDLDVECYQRLYATWRERHVRWGFIFSHFLSLLSRGLKKIELENYLNI